MSRPAHDATSLLHPVLRRVLTGLLLVSVIVPLAYMLIVSVTPDVDIAAGVVFPDHLDFGNYVSMWSTVALGRGLINSTIICGSASLGSVIVGCIAGYVSARLRFRGRSFFLSSLLGFQAVPTVMTLLPLFIVMSGLQGLVHLEIIGTYWAVAIAYLTFALPLSTWFIASYVESIPRDLEEAASLEGAGQLRVFVKVVLPLIAPAAAVAGILGFLTGWGDLLIATVLSGPGTNTVAVVLNSFLSVSQAGALPAYGVLMAASITSALPVIVLYLGLQRFVVAGLTRGAIKG